MITPTISANVITRSDGIPITTSLKVAEAFSKQHRNVTAKIKSLDCSEEFRSANFSAHPYKHQQNDETYYQYEMTKDGFMFLVMGFTGKKAAAIKEAYINAFNQMAAALKQQGKTNSYDRTCLRDAINMLVAKKGLIYSDAYSLVHQRFAVKHIEQLTAEQLPQAVEYVHRIVLEGELLGKEPTVGHELSLNKEQAATLYHLLHHVAWVYHRWHQGIADGLAAMNRPFYSTTFEHVEDMARSGRVLDRQLQQMLASYSYLGGNRP